LRDLGLPVLLREVRAVDVSRITPSDLTAMGETAAAMAMMPNNPRPATAADCTRILEGIL
jgi:alcohol dehydrogenase class IV